MFKTENFIFFQGHETRQLDEQSGKAIADSWYFAPLDYDGDILWSRPYDTSESALTVALFASKGGQSKSESKTAAARINGSKGGRPPQSRYAVVYVGAPYGLDELGEIMSRHNTYAAAEQARQKLISKDPRYYGSNSMIKYFTSSGRWTRYDTHNNNQE